MTLKWCRSIPTLALLALLIGASGCNIEPRHTMEETWDLSKGEIQYREFSPVRSGIKVVLKVTATPEDNPVTVILTGTEFRQECVEAMKARKEPPKYLGYHEAARVEFEARLAPNQGFAIIVGNLNNQPTTAKVSLVTE
jgi:hypothetical protein